MKLSDCIDGVGPAVVYHPRLAKFFGSVNAAIFFGQLYYWQMRSGNDLGVFKTADEWHDETGLSYREQATARALLRSKGYLVETNKRLEHRIYFALNIEAVDVDFDAWSKVGEKSADPEDQMSKSGSDEDAIPERRKRNSGDAENAVRGVRKAQSDNKDRLLHKITSENTPLPPEGEADTFPGFDRFWKCWPRSMRKEAKSECRKIWVRVKAEQCADAVIAHVESLKLSQQWQDEKFIPAPRVYLNQQRWDGAMDGQQQGDDAPWWKQAGFDAPGHAENNDCTQRNYQDFRNGQRIAAEGVPA